MYDLMYLTGEALLKAMLQEARRIKMFTDIPMSRARIYLDEMLAYHHVCEYVSEHNAEYGWANHAHDLPMPSAKRYDELRALCYPPVYWEVVNGAYLDPVAVCGPDDLPF